jgi:phage tail-like protein
MKQSKRLLLVFFVLTTLSAFSQETNLLKSNTTQNQTWPSRQYCFLITIGDMSGYFQEVTGLNNETTAAKSPKGNSPVYSTVKMTGIKKFGDITLKKGKFKADNKFWEWFNMIKMNNCDHKTATISLLDESGNKVMTWTLKNAWPTKITVTEQKTGGSEATVETLLISHEGLTQTK